MAEGTAGNILFGTPAVDMGNYGWVIYLYLLLLTASITAALRVWVFYLCVFYLIPLPLVLIKMRTSFGRQTSLWIGVALLTLGTGFFGVGFARAHTYTDAMSAVLMYSAVPLIPWGIFITLVPFRRRLAIVAYSVVFVLITPTIGLLMFRIS